MTIEDLLGVQYSEETIRSTAGLRGVPTIVDKDDDPCSYVKLMSEGVELILVDKRTIGEIHLYRMGYEGYSSYPGSVPGSFGFSMSRDQVRERWGGPAESGEAQVLPGLGSMPAWDSYFVGNIRVRLEYLPNGNGVRLIALTKP